MDKKTGRNENLTTKSKECKLSALKQNKPLCATLAVAVMVAIVICTLLIVNLCKKDNTPADTSPIYLEGSYSTTVESGMFAAGSTYTFNADGTGERTYLKGEELVTEAFSYTITPNGSAKTLKLTLTESGAVEVQKFDKYLSSDGVEIIMIGGDDEVWGTEYFKK